MADLTESACQHEPEAFIDLAWTLPPSVFAGVQVRCRKCGANLTSDYSDLARRAMRRRQMLGSAVADRLTMSRPAVKRPTRHPAVQR